MYRLVIAVLLMLCSIDAWSLGRLANVEILNRDTGETLPVYRHRGEYWIAGNPGARYAVLVNNLRGERLLAVTSVDGINVISGESAAWNETGYVFQPGEGYAIDGWRKSNQEVADFNFTALPNSYAALTGRAGNVGVIGVALFLEHRPPVAPVRPEVAAPSSGAYDQAATAGRAAESQAPAAVEPRLNALQDQAAAKLGTGHGARETSYVSNTVFERLSDTPNEIIRIRYDRFDNLVAMGIVRARPAPAVPDAFPDAGVSRYVPDPPDGM
jgi:hypothetical protein